MIIIPAIDLIGGQCVRLRRGDYGTAEKVAADPFETLDGFIAAGAEYLHIVDLDGAKSGIPTNDRLIREIIRRSSIPVEVGGGIRNYESAKIYIDAGCGRVIIGSAALHHPELVERLVNDFGDKIAVGIDSMHGRVKTSGWLEDSDATTEELALRMESAGVKTMIFTDISRDGMLTGPDIEGLTKISAVLGGDTAVIASGGISCIDDIAKLAELDIYGAITGKAIYSGALNLAEAVALAKSIKERKTKS